MTAEEQQRRFKGIVHVVHEYANFVSSAKMVIDGLDIDGVRFKPPINTHVAHAFYLNCRKMFDFFTDKGGSDDILAKHYTSGFKPDPVRDLPVSKENCAKGGPINKQLAHITYTRNREIKPAACKAMYQELKETWRTFREKLIEPYKSEFQSQIRKRKEPHADGQPSEFRFCDLD